ncbi:MAG TPA: hypothetical protein VG413_09610 [Candidatus Dormibacteraeota bacterium]|nr:hypothetical protein [Candidatus Dormibacteraeota bacterium]
MSPKERVITATDSSGRSFMVTARVSTGTSSYRLELAAPEIGIRSADASDVFECMCQLRARFDREGIRLCCNGARLNVWPSGMARDMGGGLRAYVLEVGRRASIDDLVDIFDSAPIEDIATVEEQRLFAEKWLAAPKVDRPKK